MIQSSRRSFFKRLALAGAGFAVLPSAATYARKWKFSRNELLWLPGGVHGVNVEFSPQLLGSTIRNLFAEQSPVAFWWHKNYTASEWIAKHGDGTMLVLPDADKWTSVLG